MKEQRDCFVCNATGMLTAGDVTARCSTCKGTGGDLWRDITGYEGLYQVSDMGGIKSLRYNFGISGGTKLSPFIADHGYLKVGLYRDGKVVQKSVHRLVAEAFISNPSNKPEVNHRNLVKSDNRLENLEWATRAENMEHYRQNRYNSMVDETFRF